jgi:hypothetical protein
VTIGDWVSVVGLLIVIWQIWRTGKIAKSTQQAVEDATRRVGVYNILLIAPELSRLEREIEDAARGGEEPILRRLLKEWRELGAELRGTLANENIVSSDLDQAIKNSVALAMVAKQGMVDGKAVDLVQATKKARNAIELVCVEMRMLTARIRSMATPLGLLEPPSVKQLNENRQQEKKQREEAIRG